LLKYYEDLYTDIVPTTYVSYLQPGSINHYNININVTI